MHNKHDYVRKRMYALYLWSYEISLISNKFSRMELIVLCKPTSISMPFHSIPHCWMTSRLCSSTVPSEFSQFQRGNLQLHSPQRPGTLLISSLFCPAHVIAHAFYAETMLHLSPVISCSSRTLSELHPSVAPHYHHCLAASPIWPILSPHSPSL